MTDRFTRPDLKIEQPSAWKAWGIASVAATLVLAIALGLMNTLGLFSIPADDQGTKTIAAALALIGSIIASVVTLVGTVIKYSIDTRNAWFSAVESHRAHALAIEAEHRNRIDAVIRAVDLLGENNKDATPHQIGGSIVALVSLGELNLAVSLLADLWPSGLVSASVAQSVLTSALKSPEDDVCIAAATAIFNNADQIHQEGSHIWPIQPHGWNSELPTNARIALAVAAAKWMHVAIKMDRNVVPSATIVLYKALDDPDETVREIAVASLRPLAEAFPQNRAVYDDEERNIITIEHLAIRLGKLPEAPFTCSYGEIAAQLVQEALTESSKN